MAASVGTTEASSPCSGIMPTPLQIPVILTVTGSPSTAGSTSDAVATLRLESVVRSALAAASSAAAPS
jgi:hypothetical protein